MLPASFAQQRLWFLDRLEPEQRRLQRAAGQPAARAARRRCARTGARTSWSSATSRCARCSRSVDGVPQQVDQPRAAARARRSSTCSGHPDAEERASALVAEEARRDLRSRPASALLRVAADQSSPTRTTCSSLTLHHIVADAWSMGVLGRELSALYGAFVDGRRRRAARAADPVRRLRGLAAGVDGQRRPRQPARLLERAAGRRARAARAAHRPSAASRAELPRRHDAHRRCRRRCCDRLRDAERARGRDDVHDAADRVRDAASRYSGQQRHRRRHAGRQPQPSRARGT